MGGISSLLGIFSSLTSPTGIVSLLILLGLGIFFWFAYRSWKINKAHEDTESSHTKDEGDMIPESQTIAHDGDRAADEIDQIRHKKP